METKLGRHISRKPCLEPELPLVHSTRCRIFMGIAKARGLKPKYCKVFRERLLYMYYGRPAYRGRRDVQPVVDVGLCPICFLFKPHILERVRRLFPFDSGAAREEMFGSHVPRKSFKRFQLTPVIKSAGRLIHYFYSSNANYYDGNAIHALAIPPSQPDAKQLHALLTHRRTRRYDDRRSVIEVQLLNSFPLRNNLLAVILPSPLLDDQRIQKIIVNSWNTTPVTYSVTWAARPIEYHGVIREIVRSLLQQGDYL